MRSEFGSIPVSEPDVEMDSWSSVVAQTNSMWLKYLS